LVQKTGEIWVLPITYLMGYLEEIIFYTSTTWGKLLRISLIGVAQCASIKK